MDQVLIPRGLVESTTRVILQRVIQKMPKDAVLLRIHSLSGIEHWPPREDIS